MIYQLAGPGKKPSVAWADLALVPDPAVWLAGRLGALAWMRMDRNVASEAEAGEPGVTETPNVSPELAAMRAVAMSTDADRLAYRAVLRPSAPEYREGCVPTVRGGYGDPLDLLPGMKPNGSGAVIDILLFIGTGETLIVMTRGAVIRAAAGECLGASL